MDLVTLTKVGSLIVIHKDRPNEREIKHRLRKIISQRKSNKYDSDKFRVVDISNWNNFNNIWYNFMEKISIH